MKQRYAALLSLVAIVILTMAGYVFIKRTPVSAPSKQQTLPQSTQPVLKAVNDTNNTYEKAREQTATPGSIFWVVNKRRPLPDAYVPPDLTVPEVRLRLSKTAEQMQLRQELALHVQNMFTAAKAAGYDLSLASGYRSYALQKQFYDSYVARDGQSKADTYSARPGTSEHQTGLAFDVAPADKRCELEQCFGDTSEGAWLSNHAHEYGFIIRYPKNKTAITGYTYEPWHVRYVGIETATEIHNKMTTLEEYFGLPPAPSY